MPVKKATYYTVWVHFSDKKNTNKAAGFCMQKQKKVQQSNFQETTDAFVKSKGLLF